MRVEIGTMQLQDEYTHMKFICGNVHTKVVCDPMDADLLAAVLRSPDVDDERTLLTRDDDVYFATGLIPYVLPLLAMRGITPVIVGDPFAAVDQYPDIPPSILATGEFSLRSYQVSAIAKAVSAGRGTVNVATGGGKTEIAIGIIRHLLDTGLARRALFVVPSSTLLQQQAYDRFLLRGFTEEEVGLVGSGSSDSGKTVTIGIVNSLYRGIRRNDRAVVDMVEGADVVIFDETHHLSADSWVRVASACQARYRFGLTATVWDDPKKLSYSDLLLIGLTGPVCVRISASFLISSGHAAKPIICMPVVDRPKVLINPAMPTAWLKVYKRGIVEHPERNSMVVCFANNMYARGYKVMVFVTEIKHGRALLARFRAAGAARSVFIHGGSSAEFYRDAVHVHNTWSAADLARYVGQEEPCVVIINQVGDEGLDLPTVNVLVLAGGKKKYRLTMQRIGRGLRPKEGENVVYVLDPFDMTHPFLHSHAKYRKWTYENEKFGVVQEHALAALLGYNPMKEGSCETNVNPG